MGCGTQRAIFRYPQAREGFHVYKVSVFKEARREKAYIPPVSTVAPPLHKFSRTAFVTIGLVPSRPFLT